MVEFVVSIIAVIVLVASMVQIGILSKVHTDVMADARDRAGEHAIRPVVGGELPDYAGSVENGPDRVNYSADDFAPRGNIFGAQTIIGYANPGELQRVVGDNVMTETFLTPASIMNGLVKGSSSRVVPMLPVIRELVNGEISINVKSKVWTASLGDIY